MRQSAEMARAYGVRLHTHLAETLDEEEFCLQSFGQRPVPYIESLGWTGEDVWHAHCVHMNQAEIDHFATSGTGIAHCPTSNMLLSSGIAPVTAWQAAGVRVGLGVDGSASNDGGHLLAEARQSMLLQKVAPDRYLGQEPGGRGGFAGDPRAMTARQALEVATRGGASVLGRDDIGYLAPGMSADFIAIRLDQLAYAGAHDPVAALLYCQPRPVDLSVINGRIVIRDGQLLTLELPPVVERQRRLARAMVRDEPIGRPW